MMEQGIDENGEFLPIPAPEGVEVNRYEEAIRWLRRPQFLSTPRYRALAWKARRDGADPRLLEWLDRTLLMLRESGIPAHAEKIVVTDAEQVVAWVKGRSAERRTPHTEGRAVELVHSIRGRELPPVAWLVFRQFGNRAADLLGIPIEWGGDEAPWRWTLPAEEAEAVEHDPVSRGLSHSPPGEREDLERYYGLKP